jgi:hypothetical protein
MHRSSDALTQGVGSARCSDNVCISGIIRTVILESANEGPQFKADGED